MRKGSMILFSSATSSSPWLLLRQLLILGCIFPAAILASTHTMGTIMDATGRILSVPGGDEFSSSSGIVTVVTSPNVPSMFLPQQHNNDDETASAVVSTRLPERPNDCTLLICQGSTLGPSPATSTAGISTTSSIGVLSPEELRCSGLAVCSAVANAIVVEGVTVGDVEAGLRHTRHARTLTALFRARVAVTTTTTIEALNEKESITSVDGDDATNIQKQTLIVAISDAPDDDLDESAVLLEVNEIFQAATVCSNNGKDMTDLYEIRVVSLSALSSSNVLDMATEAAAGASSTQDSRTSSLSVTLETALRAARAAGVTTAQGLDPPDVVQALFAVEHALARHSRTVRAKSAAWQSRIARGLLVDRFGAQASDLRTAVATAFDAETASGAGLPAVATHRFERRTQLLELVDATIRQAFAGQVANLEKLTLKRFNNQLLQTVNSPESTETVTTNNAATLRKNALLFDKAMEDLEVAVLGLSKDKAFRDISAKLNDALDAFPDSPAAKLKRTMLLNKIVNKEKEPGERSVSFGLDLVVMLRPDGFGSLQGYAGYQLPGGNSITFGVHNDADDPQVIAQFGGVRPPLLKVQPKLRIDVEM